MKFEELNIGPELRRAVDELKFTETTEIQSKSIPAILEGKDIIGHSLTGSGKTAAFGLPILTKVAKGAGLQAIILTPTRELCVQVDDALKSFAKYTGLKTVCVFGGVSIEPQMQGLKRAEIVVATPGRMLDHINRRTCDLSKIKFFVLDEADKMLEMGFIEDVEEILRHIPKSKQALMFSATMPPRIKKIIREHFRNPEIVQGQTKVDRSLLKQIYYNIKPEQKFSLLVHLLQKNHGISIVFCATRHEVDAVEKNLAHNGIQAKAIHGGLGQNARLAVVDDLRRENINVLVATDVAARGLDIRNITHVYNYDLPRSPEDYTHRIGRTARAGESGDAITLLTHPDYGNFQSILMDRTIKVEKAELPEFANIRFDRFSGQRPHQGRNFTNRQGDRQHSRGFGRPRPHSDGRGYSEGTSEGRSHDDKQSSGGSHGERPSYGKPRRQSGGFSSHRPRR